MLLLAADGLTCLLQSVTPCLVSGGASGSTERSSPSSLDISGQSSHPQSPAFRGASYAGA